MNSHSFKVSFVVLIAGMWLAQLGGCSRYRAERCFPTDLQHTYCVCGTHEAVRQFPCGVDEGDYGLKPTSWRCWSAGWHVESPCPCPGGCPACETPSTLSPTAEPQTLPLPGPPFLQQGVNTRQSPPPAYYPQRPLARNRPAGETNVGSGSDLRAAFSLTPGATGPIPWDAESPEPRSQFAPLLSNDPVMIHD